MSTQVTIGTNPVDEVYIGEQDQTFGALPVITQWDPPGDKRQNQAGTTLVGTNFDLT